MRNLLLSLRRDRQEKGFTLLEILLVVAAIAILAGIVILALNPSKQLADTRDSQRWSDVNTILNAVYQWSIDNDGTIPAGIGASAADICGDGIAPATCTSSSFVDLSALVPTYIVGIPEDPQCATANSACYQIQTTTGGRIRVVAPDAENDTIEVER